MNKLSPKKYIITKGRKLPFYECFINGNWQDSGLATIVICKEMPSGKFIIALYMVDIFCLGLKNTFYKFNLDSIEYNEFLKKFNENSEAPQSCDPIHVHNIIYGAIDYADEIGFKPHKDFDMTEYLLDPDLITYEIDEIEFGNDGKPLYISGPDDNVPYIIRTLEKNVGEGNYHFITKKEQFEDDF